METVKEFWNEFKERVSSPFFASFIISWVIFNYPIIIGLLFYKQPELKADGYVSYLDLINQCYNSWNMIWYPLITATAYTLILKELLRIIQARITTWSTRFILWMTKKSVVGAELHRALEKALNVKIAEYAVATNDEGLAVNKNLLLEAKIIEKDTLISDKDSALSLKDQLHLNEITELREKNGNAALELRKVYDGRIETLEKQNTKYVQDLESRFDDTILPLRESLVTVKLKVGELEQENERLNSSVDRINELLFEKEKARVELQRDYEDLEAKIGLLSNERDVLNHSVTEMNRKIQILKILEGIDVTILPNGSKGKLINSTTAWAIRSGDQIFTQNSGSGEVVGGSDTPESGGFEFSVINSDGVELTINTNSDNVYKVI